MILSKHSNKPKQYKLGWSEFYKLKFKVNPNVLIPRPETELLVDEVLSYINNLSNTLKKDILVLDIGTGCGNIAISISKNSPQVKAVASDKSEAALKVAAKNARLHKVLNRIKLIQSDLLENLLINKTKYKLLIIVANLPYIPSERIPYLDSSVRDFEPWIALDGGESGFELYKKLFGQIQNLYLKSVKLIVCEIDYTHKQLAIDEALKYFPDFEVEVKTDLAHRQRILKIKDPSL